MSSQDVATPPPGTPRLRPLAEFLTPGFPPFRVEAYQRGYKWQITEVETLLRDIASFSPTPHEAHYCLQPIVVCRHGDPVECWELIDGQQRLTTIYLILCCLRAELDCAPYALQYCTRMGTQSFMEGAIGRGRQPFPRWNDFLAQQPDPETLNNADIYHFHEAWNTIVDFVAKLPDRTAFLARLRDCRVIWYEPSAGQAGAREAFQRLNSGKIALTDAELVKALFLRSHVEAEVAAPWQMEMAREWDAMEAALHDPVFWHLLTGRPRNPLPATRIALVLDLASQRSPEQEEPHFCYLAFAKRFAESMHELETERELAWLEIKACFAILCEWLEDAHLYHLVGFIIARTLRPLAELLRESRHRTKTSFRAWLTVVIQHRFANVSLSELSFEARHQHPRLHDALLLFNVLPLMKENAATHFRFDLFYQETWSLEHIHAQNARDLTEAEWGDWYMENHALLQPGELPLDAQADAAIALQKLDSWWAMPAVPGKSEALAAVDEALGEFFGRHFSTFELHGLGNLALLSREDNSSLGNKPFSAKRAAILEKDQEGRFIPVETRNVFLKSYSAEPATLRLWSRKDRTEYLQAIRERLRPFIPNVSAPPEAAAPRPAPLAPASLRPRAARAEASTAAAPESAAELPRTTLWQLLHQCRIEIPLIQRDYAQGRAGDSRAKQIREEFGARLFAALGDPSSGPLDLDLMFGKIMGERLIPLDGQQRLTTLFLLHWLLARHASGPAWGEARRILEKFSYETRTSSRDFCRALCLEEFVLTGGPIRELLTDQPWFQHTWRSDPTVTAMLETLSFLHGLLLKRLAAAQLWIPLIAGEDCPIFFHFLALAQLGLSDDLYLRLNARGRALTDFENFKAWLGERLDSETERKLDTAWANFFWRHAQGRESSDAQYLQFFKATALNEALAEGASVDLVKLLTRPYVSTAEYREHDVFPCARLAKLVALLDLLAGGGWDQARLLLEKIPHLPAPSLLARFTAENVEYQERALFFAYTRAAALPNPVGFSRWMRVLRNLLTRSSVDAASLPAIIRGIESLSRDVGEIHAALANSGFERPAGFDPTQWREEVIKARLILADPAWEEPLSMAEDHPWFRGEIAFLLRDPVGGSLTLERFQDRFAKARQIFVEGGLLHDGSSVFERALLTVADYSPSGGPNFSFSGGTDFWIPLLRLDHQVPRVLALLDAPEVQAQTLAEDLERRSQAYRPTPDNWRIFFTRSPHAFSACGPQKRVQWKGDHYILLLPGKRWSSGLRELRAWCLLGEVKAAGWFQPLEWQCAPALTYEGPAVFVETAAFYLSVRYTSLPGATVPGEYLLTLRWRGAQTGTPPPAGFTPAPELDTFTRTAPDESSALAALCHLADNELRPVLEACTHSSTWPA
jgi:hypothetical protein